MGGCDALAPTPRHHDSCEDPAFPGRSDLRLALHPTRPAGRGGRPAGGGCPAVPAEGLGDILSRWELPPTPTCSEEVVLGSPLSSPNNTPSGSSLFGDSWFWRTQLASLGGRGQGESLAWKLLLLRAQELTPFRPALPPGFLCWLCSPNSRSSSHGKGASPSLFPAAEKIYLTVPVCQALRKIPIDPVMNKAVSLSSWSAYSGRRDRPK